jgi:predicted nucleic acid-binding protein
VDEGDKSKQEAARNWRSALWTSPLGRLSVQVLGEFYVNAMRLRPSARDEARAEIVALLAWNPVVADAALSQRGWELQDRYRPSYWDSLILAAAKVAPCGYLLTEDFEAGQNLDGVEVVNPFLRGPDDILQTCSLTAPQPSVILQNA